MAHFAEVNEDNIVTRVLVTDNNDPNGDEGYQWLVDNFGGTWIKTSYNGNIRKNFASIGYSYNEELDAFVAPQPYESWTLDLGSARWMPPVNMPDDGENYLWDEDSKTWISSF